MNSDFNIENEKIFGERLANETYVVRQGVYGVVFNTEGKVAVIKNKFGHFLPGGGIEEGENFEECLRREFLEEIGYSIKIKKFIGKHLSTIFQKGLIIIGIQLDFST